MLDSSESAGASECWNIFAMSCRQRLDGCAHPSDMKKTYTVVGLVLTIENATKMLNFHYSCPIEFKNRFRSFFSLCCGWMVPTDKILVARRAGLR